MNRAIDPQYRFNFVEANDRRYNRQYYWETLYAFAYGGRHIVAAARVVPFNSSYEALYAAFKGERRDALTQHLLPETIQEPLLQASRADNTLQTFVDNITALMPKQTTELPEALLKETEAELEESASQALIQQGIEDGLNSFAAAETTPFLTRDDDPLQALPGEAEDTALIRQSVHVYAALKTQMRKTMQTRAEEGALVPHGDLEFDLSARLYSNPQYLAFVRRLIDAKGSYVSPVVRDFLSFYSRCLNIKLNQHARSTHTDTDVLKGRVESMLGREKEGGHYYLDYHDLIILGTLEEGEIKPDPDDPDQTGSSYKIAPHLTPDDILLREIGEQRFLVRKFIEHMFNAHHNSKSVQFIDEVEAKKHAPMFRMPLPDPVERKLHALVETLDAWIAHNHSAMVKGGFTLVLICLLGVLGIVLLSFLRMSGP